jgi:DNA-binding beta-propeller fold protein YncE
MAPKISDGASPQLKLGFVNSADKKTTQDVIFITTDASYNKLTLQIGLRSGEAQLSPGTIPDPLSPPTSGTTVYLDLTALKLSPDCWTNMTFANDDWKFQKFADESTFGMTPAKPITLTSDPGAVSIGIGGIVVPQPLADPSVTVYVTYYGIPTLTGNDTSFPVAITRAPDQPGNLHDAITLQLNTDAGVVNSALDVVPPRTALNAFSLQFVSRQTETVTAGKNTKFTVKFVYGKAGDPYGFGALTDTVNGGQIHAVKGLNATDWDISFNKDDILWTLQPKAGDPIVGSGEESIVEIKFSNLLTTYQPGPTTMMVSYEGIEGYNDGVFVLVLEKVAHAVIRSLSVSPNPTWFSNGSAQVTVGWTADGTNWSNEGTLELTQNYQTTDVSGKTQAPATLVAETTPFALKATGAPGMVENVDYKSVTAFALPKINSFTGLPTEIFSGSLSHDAWFNWAVDTTEGVKLSATQGAFTGQPFGNKGPTSATIRQPQMVTLAPVVDRGVNPLTLTRHLVISAFTPTPQNVALGFTPAAAAASPSGPFLVLAGPSGSLTVADTVQYATLATVPVGHPATSAAFSPDGTKLATANSDKTVTILGVTLNAAGMPTFGAATTVSLPAAPQQLVFSPDGARIFVTVDPGEGKSGQVVALNAPAGTWQVEGSVTVGKAPRGLALDPAGTRLFVANSGDDTATVVGLASGALGGVVATVQQLAGGPTGIAVTPTAGQLLVACANAGTVIAVEPNYPNTGQRTTLHVGKSPGAIAVTPNGSYAFVANGGDGTLSLIDCDGLPSETAVVGKPITVGSQPAGVTVSPDGLQVLVATSGGFTAVTLATYETTSASPKVHNRPTDVAVTPDGSAVWAWHDAAIPAISHSRGILVYAPQSGSTTNVLPRFDVLGCVISPDPYAKQAFVIVKGDPQVHVIATDTHDASRLPLGLAAGTAPVALAISGEGRTLFIVAADASNKLSLVVLQQGQQGWATTQTLALFQTGQDPYILLRATPDGTTLFVVDGEADAATVRAVQKSGPSYALSPTVIKGDVRANDLAILPDGSTAYVLNAGTTAQTVTVIDVASLASHVDAVPQVPPSYVNLTALQPSPDGRRLFAADVNANAVRVLDPRSLRILQTIPFARSSSGVSGLAVSADGSGIFVANTTSQTLSIVQQIQMVGPSSPALILRARALADDPYNGLFMRHFLRDQPGMPPDGWAYSPDIIFNGQVIEPDLSKFTTADSYAKDYGGDVKLGNPNYIYVRGFNTTNAQITSRAYFYHVQSNLAMWPQDWVATDVTVDGNVQNWVDITAPVKTGASIGVGVGQSPILWQPPKADQLDFHYCVQAWVVNGPNPQPPNLPAIGHIDDLVNFVDTHHNLAWRNTNDFPTPPPDFKYSHPIAMKSGGGTVMLSISFVNIPADGTFSVNMQGPDANNSIALPQSPVPPLGTWAPLNNRLHLTKDFKTSLNVYHWPGATKVPNNAQINVQLAVQTAPSLQRDIERRYRPLGLRTPFRRFGDVNAFVLGTIFNNLKFGGA